MAEQSHETGDPADRGDTVERLRQLIPDILQRWEVHVRAALPPLRYESSPFLRDHLPAILEDLAAELASSTDPGACYREFSVVRQHREQRQRITDYTADHALLEYRMLRRSIFEILEADAPLSKPDRDLIVDCIELMMQKSVALFTQPRQEGSRPRGTSSKRRKGPPRS